MPRPALNFNPSFHPPGQPSHLGALSTRHVPDRRRHFWTDACHDVQLLRRIGRGCHGDVYHAIDCRSGDHVAVKAIPTKGNGTPGSRVAPFKIDLEADIHAAVHDVSSIVEFKAHRRGKTMECLITELCRGGDLAQYLRARGRLNEGQLCVVAAAALEAVLTCHRRGILHGDLKAANFVIRTLRDACLLDRRPEELDRGWLKAVDFGCAVRMGKTKCNGRRGTPTHWCPEVFAERYDLSADMWSLGSMLFQLAADRMPFFDKREERCLRSERDILLHVIQRDVNMTCPPWNAFSDDAKDFIQRLLRKDASDRMTIEAALDHPFVKKAATERMRPAEMLMYAY